MPPTTTAAPSEGPKQDADFGESAMLQPDRPLSSNDLAMANLEQEIVALDETISALNRRLKPVKDNSAEKTAAVAERVEPSQNPPALSPLAQSIDEKANRVRAIRRRVDAITSSIDL